MPTSTSSVERNLKNVFIVSGVLLLISSIASFFSISQLISSSEQVKHTYEVILGTERISYSLRETESAHRGYLLTKDQVLLQEFVAAQKQTNTAFSAVKQLTVDNSLQQQNLQQLQSLILRRFNQFETALQTAKWGSDSADLLKGQLLQGKNIMDEVNALLQSVRDEENRLLAQRVNKQENYITYSPILIVIAALISIAITILAYSRITKDLRERREKQLAEAQKYAETTERIGEMESITRQIAAGDYAVRSTDETPDELGRIGIALNEMAGSLETSFNELQQRSWIQSASAAISNALRGHENLRTIADAVSAAVAVQLNAPAVAFYTLLNNDELQLQGGYAVAGAPRLINRNEGIVGQATQQSTISVIEHLPAGHIRFASALGESSPATLTLVPVFYSGKIIGLMEIGSTSRPSSTAINMLELNTEAIGIAVNAVMARVRLQELFEETQAQSEELQTQHSELENINSELEAQTEKLQASEEELKVQQEELLQANGELEERSRLLEERNQLIVERNAEIQQKAEELALSTKYKSEFLANMSHELRTPLNSVLLLSRLLAENGEKNLSDDQVEYAQVIQSSGQGLLSLIDEILDLSKIEAGKMELEYRPVMIQDIITDMRALFMPVAKDKKVELILEQADDLPTQIETDKMRLEQVLKNLLSNALKFTKQGSVKLSVKRLDDYFISFSVKDSGIGIPKAKQAAIFEAFQQADGSTRRKYGGTGLGLSISRELTRLLGGDIKVESEEGKGAEFIVHVPTSKKAAAPKPVETAQVIQKPVLLEESPKPARNLRSQIIPENVADDRHAIGADDKIILIIEDDTGFAKALLDFTHKKGYKGLVAVRGDDGIALAQEHLPAGILLDIQLPVKDGWEVMEELKANPATRHIPVHIMSSLEAKRESLLKGAVDFINKPMAFEQMQEVFSKLEKVLSRENKKVLIVEENAKHAKALAYFLETFNVATAISTTINNSVESLQKQEVDCVILDMGIPDQAAYKMLEEVKKNPGLENLPIIIFTGKNLSKVEESRIRQYADSIVVKTAHSYQRILDEVSLFLHLMEESKTEEKQVSKYRRMGALNEVLAGKKVLVTDDDVRNIFSLTKALEIHNVKVVTAVDGKEALAMLNDNPDTDLVLMDIMMPEMDGYEAMRNIRHQLRFRNLPIIAVTAKAMTGDREKCIQAGASDYISKPIDIDQLMSLLRVWLYDKSI